MTFRTLQDAQRVLDAATDLRQAVVIGSGTLGLEWVQGLRQLGVEVTYLLRERRLLPRILDEEASELVLQRLRSAGVTVIVEDEAAEIRVAPRGRQLAGAGAN